MTTALGDGTILPQETRLTGLLGRAADARPDGDAIADRDGSLSWRSLAQQVDGFSAQLAALGIGPGDRVALWLPNGRTYLRAIFAVARRGAIAIHVNTRFGQVEVGDLLARSGASVLVTCSGFGPTDFLQLLATVPAELRTRLRAIVCAGPAPASVAGHDVLPVRHDGSAPDLSEPDHPCLTYTTGGTTARPKLVLHTQRSIARHACEVMARLGMDRPDAALLAAVPFCGTFGNVAAMAAVAGGASIVAMEAFDPVEADRLIRVHRVTHLVGDDRMMGRLAEVALNGPGPHEGIHFFGLGPLQTDAELSCRRGLAAGLPSTAIYGSSEVQALFALGEIGAGAWGEVTPVSADAEFSIDAGAGEAELSIRAPSLFHSYLGDADAPLGTATPALSADGWFRTGDLAKLDGTGFVFGGRMGDVLRLGGFLVAPQEIEAFLGGQPNVAGAQVVGVETARGMAAFAFVVPTAGTMVDEATLLAACRKSLARYKVPARIISVTQFPTSIGPNGPKISKAQLRQEAVALVEEGSLT